MSRARRALCLVLLTSSTGCLDSLLEAPFVLTPGLGSARSLAPTSAGNMLVAGEAGVYEIDGSGAVSQLREGSSLAVGSHPERLYVLDADELHIGEGLAGARTWSALSVPDARDLQAWCEETLVVATRDGLHRWRPGMLALEPWHQEVGNLRGLALDLTGECERLLAVNDHQVLRIDDAGITVVIDRLVEARAVASDRKGRIWVVHGTPPVLSRQADSGRLEPVARHLGDPKDLHFGMGGLFSPENIYLADGGGTLDYLRVPPETSP